MGAKSSKSNPKEEIRLVLLGKTGSGKSATGNTILGSPEFSSEASSTSITHACALQTAVRFDKRITICDTPSVFDTEESNEKIQNEICKCLCNTSPGPHAFILVLNADVRYTHEDKNTVEHFVKYFGKDIYKYLIVVFTRKDQLDKSGMSLETFIQRSPRDLQNLIKDCGERVFAINNTLKGWKNEKQVQGLLRLISENVSRNLGTFYTDEIFKKVEEEIRIEEEKRKQMIAEEIERKKQEMVKKVKDKNEEQLKKIDERTKKEYRDRTIQIRYEMFAEAAKNRIQNAVNFAYDVYERVAQMLQAPVENQQNEIMQANVQKFEQ